ncbi:MAG: NAD(+)/NADH kinase [Treponema sp.]|nr:NAD(+)/NADH kinase [Treponema sp.]
MKKVLVIVNTGKEKSTSLAKDISLYLEEKGFECSLFNFDGFSKKNPVSGCDFVITLGGDGTVLFAARCCAKFQIPVFPVNLGEFGFIAGVQPEKWKKCLDSFLAGKAPVAERSLVSAEVVRDGKTVSTCLGLNDIVISAKEAVKTISLVVSYNKQRLTQLKSDGVIISTPTGSTGYSSSAGGPIIDPDLDALVFTPNNAFSLSARPIVLNPEGEICVEVQESRTKEMILSADAQLVSKLKQGDLVKVRRYDNKALLVYCTTENFYKALLSKRNWSGGPNA